MGMKLAISVLLSFVVVSECDFISYLFYRQDKAKALEILVQDLRVFSTFNEDLYKEITQLLTLQNFRYEIWNQLYL